METKKKCDFVTDLHQYIPWFHKNIALPDFTFYMDRLQANTILQ